MAVLFVCCVVCYGKEERFSTEAMLNNLTNIQDMPTIQDIVDCWTSDSYYVGNCLNLEWVRVYSGVVPMLEYHHGEDLLYYGQLPLAINSDGTIDKNYAGHYSMMYLYDSVGNPYYHLYENGEYAVMNYYPVIRQPLIKYESYSGDNEILSFFDYLKSIFVRIGNTLNLVVKIIVSIFKNLKYLLPWNNTVPRGQW